MTRKSFYSVVAIILLTCLCNVAWAQEDLTSEEPEVTYGGWAAFSGFGAFAAFFPVLSIVGTLLYQPPHPPHVCQEYPEKCSKGIGTHVLMGTAVIGVGAMIVGASYLGSWIARELEFGRKLGWGLAGGMTGLAVTAMWYLVIPPFEPSWLHQSIGLLTFAGGAVGTGLLFSEIASKRGHAWPEFGFTLGGLALGLGVGSLFYTPEMNKYPIAPQLGAGLGALTFGIASSLLWGYDPPSKTGSQSLTLSIPLLSMQF